MLCTSPTLCNLYNRLLRSSSSSVPIVPHQIAVAILTSASCVTAPSRRRCRTRMPPALTVLLPTPTEPGPPSHSLPPPYSAAYSSQATAPPHTQTRTRESYLPNKLSSHPISPPPNLPPLSVPTSGSKGAGSLSLSLSFNLLLSLVSGRWFSSTASSIPSSSTAALEEEGRNMPLLRRSQLPDFLDRSSGRC